MSAIEVSALVVRYGNLVAVDGVSLTAEAGQVTALLGPNGAGKTSIVETLEGYRRPDSGLVRVLGLDPRRDLAALTPRIGVMLQSGGVYPAMTAVEVLTLFASYYPRHHEVSAMIERVGLTAAARTPWRRLSGGEQQRVSLALALIGLPEVAFLDEPTAGIDPQGRLAIREVIRQLRAEGVCVVLTTHELEEAERLADEIVIIDHGRVVASGSPAELRSAPHTADEVRFAAPPRIDVASMTDRLGVSVVEDRPGQYRVAARPSPGLVADITGWLAEHNLPLDDLRAGRQTLEDVFLRLTESGE